MSSAKISLGLLQRISEFLADLPEDHLEDLADGRARLAYVRVGETSRNLLARPPRRAHAPPPRRSFSYQRRLVPI